MPTKRNTSRKSASKKNGKSVAQARSRKSSASPTKKSSPRNAKADDKRANGANGKGDNGQSPTRKRRYTKKDYDKMTPNEVMLLAWEAIYANRHKRLT